MLFCVCRPAMTWKLTLASTNCGPLFATLVACVSSTLSCWCNGNPLCVASRDSCLLHGHGRFSKPLTVLNQVGWSILQSPFVRDLTGGLHDLLGVPTCLLRWLFEQAWLKFVAGGLRDTQTNV